MKRIIAVLLLLFLMACNTKTEKKLSAQEIIDKSITASGGVERYQNSTITFNFRDRNYISEMKENRKTLKRTQKTDSVTIVDILNPSGFERYENDSLVTLHDSLITKYGNAVNSVHYFAKLPYGLNDRAVHKEFLGQSEIKGKTYYKVKITFDEEGGGDDFDDTYVYFFNTETYKPDYLAYDFHVNGGGMRFREAYNERYVNGIRFVDYKNLKPVEEDASVLAVDSLFINDKLELLSTIELTDIEVTLGNYN